MMIYDQQGKIVEKKFYHSEWKLTDLLKARNDGLLTDEGEAWKYRYSHMDGTGGKYDLLFRREPAAIEAPAQEPVSGVREAIAAIFAEDDQFIGIGQDSYAKADRVLALTTPPGALALVAAAYRDAAEQCQKERRNVSQLLSNPPQSDAARMIGIHIAERTPADATAALAAIERAAYERGVRDTALARMTEKTLAIYAPASQPNDTQEGR